MKTALTLILALTTAMALAAPVKLQPYEANYTVTRDGSRYGTGYRMLEVSPEGEWQLRGKTDISWFILSDTRETRSVFTYHPKQQRFEPIEFLYMRTGTGSDKSFHATFDVEQQEIRNVDNGRLIEMDWQHTIYDEASVIEKLRLDVAAGKSQFEYHLIDEEGHPDTYRFATMGKQTISTPYGTLKTIKVERLRDSSRRQTYFWFAPELNYLLVQMQQFKEGEEQAKMSLSAYKPLKAK